MKHVKLYEDFTEVTEINESKAGQVLAKLGKAAAGAIITFLINNPEVIQSVLNGLLSSKDRGVQNAVKGIK